MYDLEEIRAHVSLVALAEEAGARFDNPHQLTSHCPLPRHAGDRSSRAFSIFDRGMRWKCHSSCPPDACGGDLFDFYMAWKCVDFKTAVNELGIRYSLTERDRIAPKPGLIPPVPASPRLLAPNHLWQKRAGEFIASAGLALEGNKGDKARAYLKQERGLSPETWRAFHLGFNPEDRYEDPAKWGLEGKKIWLPRGIVIPGFWQEQPMYIKVRRPLPEHSLENYIGAWTVRDGLPDAKYGGPRGGKSALFHLELMDHLPVLLLAEGEWDTMLLWEHCADLCDIATLGGAQSKFDSLDLALLTRYLAILVVHDDDIAGEHGRDYISKLHAVSERIVAIQPPAHDLTDYWKSGGDLRIWTAMHVYSALADALNQANTSALERLKKIFSNIKAELVQSGVNKD
jgi:hypothetical protein